MDAPIEFVKQSIPPSPKEIPVRNLFVLHYGRFPQIIRFSPATEDKTSNVVFHVKSVLNRLYSEYDASDQFAIVRQYFHPCSKKYYVSQQLLSLPNTPGILIYLKVCYWVTNYTNHSKQPISPDYLPNRHFLIVDDIHVLYLSEHEFIVQKLVYDLIHDDTLGLIEPKRTLLRLIGRYRNRCNGPGSFYLTGSTSIKKPHIGDLALNYGGEDFLRIHKKITTWLNRKDANGLVLLHGTPGSGKTHYIRYLLNSISNGTERHLIYLPGDMINDLSNPTLIPLLVNCPNALLIIEDAEESLSRTRTSSQSVSNLLNLSDGLLSDGIQVQIIATFNCPLTSLDSALLRPGRLIVQYHFPSTLTIDNARRLAESIGVTKLDQINQPLSLASIYAMKDEKIDEEEQDEETSSCRKCSSSRWYDDDEEE